jgi:hypothetical protein
MSNRLFYILLCGFLHFSFTDNFVHFLATEDTEVTDAEVTDAEVTDADTDTAAVTDTEKSSSAFSQIEKKKYKTKKTN